MIARIWYGVTLASRADAYAEYLSRTGVKDCLATEGNCGVTVLRRISNGQAEFVFISLWESMSAIEKFAGPDLEKAVYYPEDKEFLLQLVPQVLHYDVLVPAQELTGTCPPSVASIWHAVKS